MEHDAKVIDDPETLLKYGVVKVKLPSQAEFDCEKWATELSQISPLNIAGYGDNEDAFYRNIMDEPDFPFELFLSSEIGEVISKYFLQQHEQQKQSSCEEKDQSSTCCADEEKKEDQPSDVKECLRLDDAFCIHYNTEQDDTTCAKHMDPSDITVNMCLEKSDDVTGSEVKFYGTQSLQHIKKADENLNKGAGQGEDFSFLVNQEQGYATIHYGCHPHETIPLKRGRRTNIVLTYCYKDESKSGVALRTCYATS